MGVITTHTDKHGNPKILERCTLPLTAINCVDRIYTDMAVCDITSEGLILKEIAEGVSVEDVVNATGADLTIPGAPLPTF